MAERDLHREGVGRQDLLCTVPVDQPWDEYDPDDDFDEGDALDDEPDEADCGRWINGRLSPQCRLAGSEWCDWDCPIGLGRRALRPDDGRRG